MGRTVCTEPQCLYKGTLYLLYLCGKGGYTAHQHRDKNGNSNSTITTYFNLDIKKKFLYAVFNFEQIYLTS